jgi:XTP/dITP diphosphohydrolase
LIRKSLTLGLECEEPEDSVMPTLLVLGTRNRKKLAEMARLLEGLPWEVADLSRFADAPEIEEDGRTFAENARKKAAGLARALGHWVLGEDSGLVVPALGGAPGVLSARFAGRHGDDDANNALLLQKLEPLPDEQRDAYYVCAAALANPAGEIAALEEGRCGGRIARELRGTNGFGYDPIFLIPEYHRTFGELSPRVKEALSHRARAMTRLRSALQRLEE